MSTTKEAPVKILIPIAKYVDKVKITSALHALSAFRSPLIVLFHIIEFKSRTTTLIPSAYEEQIAEAEKNLRPIADWLKAQGYKVTIKTVIGRNTAEGIVDEANTGNYTVILMMKRKMRTGIARLFHKSISENVIRHAKCMVISMLVDF